MTKLCHLTLISFFPLSAFSQYLGGAGDAYASNILTQTVCSALASTNFFYGGNSDGDDTQVLTQTVCSSLPSTNIFYGGNADGYSYNTLTQTICPPLPSTNVFYGGSADGFVNNVLTQTACFPLPVELLSFNAECDNRKVILNWVTASEQNSSYFNIERSVDAVNYFSVRTVTAAGNSSILLRYSFTDTDPLSLGYYRLGETDFNGQTEIFPPIAVPCSQNTIEIYPDINDGLFTIRSDKKIHVSINNAIGESIYSAELNPGIQHIDIHAQPGGIYFVNVISVTVGAENESFTQKIIIQK